MLTLQIQHAHFTSSYHDRLEEVVDRYRDRGIDLQALQEELSLLGFTAGAAHDYMALVLSTDDC